MALSENFAISLITFAGVAATILMGIKDKKKFNGNNPLFWVASIYISGVVLLLIYGASNNVQWMNWGYGVVFSATVLLMFILLCFVLPPLLGMVIILLRKWRDLCKTITQRT